MITSHTPRATLRRAPHSAAGHPAPVTPRDPEPPRLTPDEIRAIVLELMG